MPAGAVSSQVQVDIRRRTWPVTLTFSAYDQNLGRYATATVAEELVGPLRIMFREADGDVEYTCFMGSEQCSTSWLTEGESYRATVEDIDGHVFGRSPLYTVGPDDPEPPTSYDADLGDLSQMLAPLGVSGVCDAVLTMPGTHVAQSSVTDQWLACDAARTSGKSLLATLAAIGAVAGSSQVIWLLYHRGLDAQTDTPTQYPNNPVPDPVRVPPVLPVGSAVATLAEDLLERNSALTQKQADTLARTCLWLVARAALNAAQKCGSLPIFASGSDVPEATQHDLEGLTQTPSWIALNYEGPNKPGAGWQTNLCNPPPDTLTQQCDEYPFFATLQGGPNASPAPDLKAISKADNQLQGSRYGNFVVACGLANAEPFLAIPIHPQANIPTLRVC